MTIKEILNFITSAEAEMIEAWLNDNAEMYELWDNVKELLSELLKKLVKSEG